MHTVKAHKLLEAFHLLCAAHSIDYFAIYNTLIGAITYSDFIPEATGIEIGLLRTHYVALEQALSHHESLSLVEGNFEHDGQHYFAAVTSIEQNSEEPSTNPNVNDEDLPTIFIQVFDGVTNDYDLTRFQMFRVKQARKQGLRAQGAARKRALQRAWQVADTYNHAAHDEVAYLFGGNGRCFPLADLATVRTHPVGAGEICIPNRTDCWIPEDRTEELQRAHVIQQDLLFIAKEIDRICRLHDIGYFICSGTLLGAVRSGSFIPWDDDIDIGMLREDYNRFLEIAPDELRSNFFLQTRQSDPHAPYLYAKLRLNGTEYVTPFTEGHDFHPGISIDIFPFDRAPVEDACYPDCLAKALELAQAHQHLANKQVSVGLAKRSAQNPTEVIGHAVMSAQHALYRNKPLASTQAAYEAHVTQSNQDPRATWAVSYVAEFTPTRLADLLPLQDIEFEGHAFLAPSNPAAMLEWLYGPDYLTPPPPHLQHGHYLIRWKTRSQDALL